MDKLIVTMILAALLCAVGVVCLSAYSMHEDRARSYEIQQMRLNFDRYILQQEVDIERIRAEKCECE